MTNNENTTEVWKPIPGWEQYYEASTHGRIRSLDRFTIRSNGRPYRRKGRILKPWAHHRTGYLSVGLYIDTKSKRFLVHRLVLTTFVGEPPAGTECCHNNGNRADNRLENLRWDTKKANAQDTLKHGKNFHANKTHCPRGHALIEPNLEGWKLRNGGRKCLACHKARDYVRNRPELQNNIKQISDSYYTKITGS